jgi:hypothetical protein
VAPEEVVMRNKIPAKPLSRRVAKGSGQRIEDIIEPWPMEYRRRRPLSVTHPEVAQFWYYKKNCGYGSEDFSFGSNVKAWWWCPEGEDHISQSTIYGRVKHFTNSTKGCPFCRGHKPSVTNSVASRYPELAKEWAPGNELTPDQITWGSERHVLWQCQRGHVWSATPHTRIRGSGCPK